MQNNRVTRKWTIPKKWYFRMILNKTVFYGKSEMFVKIPHLTKLSLQHT
jgi:hypothetical protein